jgi:hypothetical protein
MKLLFDQNLSPRLPAWLADLFPGSGHVADLGLDQASDDDVWDYARVHGFAIVTKDADYADLSVLRGHPPTASGSNLGIARLGRSSSACEPTMYTSRRSTPTRRSA